MWNIALLVLFVSSLALPFRIADTQTPDSTKALGTVRFPISCSPAAQSRFNTAVTLLHSFWYDKAEERFRQVASADPSCAMAYWGIAMTHWHELWEPPDATDVKVASQALARAHKVGAKTARERQLIAAIAAYYQSYDFNDDTRNRNAYLTRMRALYDGYPRDRQVALFYALALIAASDPRDPTFKSQRAAAAILEPIFAIEPDDPGAAHYIIHAYDDPALAAHALHAAREYAKIAPAVPHALHMPSHTFTDLGLWEDSISSNRASLAAELLSYPREKLGASTFDDFHGADFLSYAYVQAGRARDAQALADQLAAVRPLPDGIYPQYEYTLTLTRQLVDRSRWAAAAHFQLPVAMAQTKYPGVAAIAYYVQGLGAARMGDLSTASAKLRQLDGLSAWAEKGKEKPLVRYLGVERDSLSGWIARARGDDDGAIRSLRSAAQHSKRIDAPPPLMVWPVQEQLGYLLLELHRSAEARSAFEAALRQDPNRLLSLSGAAQAAAASGDHASEVRYAKAILASCPRADADNAEVVRARALVSARP